MADKQSFYDSTGCDFITAFLLDNAELDRTRFILSYNKMTTKNSSMNILTGGLEAVIFNNPPIAYQHLDYAGTFLYEQFKRFGDVKRELVYTYLILELKKQTLLALFDDRAKVEKLFNEKLAQAIETRPYLAKIQKR